MVVDVIIVVTVVATVVTAVVLAAITVLLVMVVACNPHYNSSWLVAERTAIGYSLLVGSGQDCSSCLPAEQKNLHVRKMCKRAPSLRRGLLLI